MTNDSAWLDFLINNTTKLLELTLEHVGITLLSLLAAVLISIPAGIWIARKPRISGPVLALTGILQTIPSIALLGFMIPLLGIGIKPAIAALFLYALLPIVRNTFTGIQQVDPAIREAALGMGMTSWQLLLKVELPLALPVIYAGVRTATVINVGVATLAAYIGAGGLGEFIFGGIALNNTNMILLGAIPAALLAILFDQLLALMHKQGKSRPGQSSWILVIFTVLSLLSFSRQWQSDLLSAGFGPEFYGRQDGYPSLQATYGLDFNTLLLSPALMYEAIRTRQVDVIAGYSTDGRVKAYQLQTLKDDKAAFPPYFCAPLVREATLESHPELEQTLELLAGKINDSLMTELNYRIDHLKESVSDVAQDFLSSINLWRPDQQMEGPTITIGSKIFSEQYLLAEIYSQLINGHTNLDVDLRPGLGGTKICFDALLAGEIDLYMEYTGTGFQVILNPGEQTLSGSWQDADAVFNFVRDAFARQHKLRWLTPLGFNNTYALMVREETARQQGWSSISDLLVRDEH